MKLYISDDAVEKIQQLVLESDSFAYLVIDDEGRLIDIAGELYCADLSAWTIGENILDSAMFLLGNIPMTADYESILCYQLSERCIIDVQLFRDERFNIVLLIDRSASMEAEARVRQGENEEKLRALSQVTLSKKNFCRC